MNDLKIAMIIVLVIIVVAVISSLIVFSFCMIKYRLNKAEQRLKRVYRELDLQYNTLPDFYPMPPPPTQPKPRMDNVKGIFFEAIETLDERPRVIDLKFTQVEARRIESIITQKIYDSYMAGMAGLVTTNYMNWYHDFIVPRIISEDDQNPQPVQPTDRSIKEGVVPQKPRTFNVVDTSTSSRVRKS